MKYVRGEVSPSCNLDAQKVHMKCISVSDHQEVLILLGCTVGASWKSVRAWAGIQPGLPNYFFFFPNSPSLESSTVLSIDAWRAKCRDVKEAEVFLTSVVLVSHWQKNVDVTFIDFLCLRENAQEKKKYPDNQVCVCPFVYFIFWSCVVTPACVLEATLQ